MRDDFMGIVSHDLLNLFHDQTEDSDGNRARQREGWPAGNTDVPASRKVADAIRHLSGSRPRGAEGE